MPFAFIFGDKDKAACAENDPMAEPMVAANGCTSMETAKGDGFPMVSYKNPNGQAMVIVTIMKNMPHGAVYEESRLTWEFLRQFCRIGGSRKVKACRQVSAKST